MNCQKHIDVLSSCVGILDWLYADTRVISNLDEHFRYHFQHF